MTEIRWAGGGGDEAVIDHVAEALRNGGTAAVPGRARSEAILRGIAGRPLPWQRTAFTLTDDFELSPDHPASRYGRLERMFGETGAVLARFAPVWEGFRFRLVWVDVGKQGEVASIFPGLPIAAEAPPDLERVRPQRPPPGEGYARVTLNYAALANCDELIVAVAGDGREALESALGGDVDLPVGRLLRLIDAPVTIFAERARTKRGQT